MIEVKDLVCPYDKEELISKNEKVVCKKCKSEFKILDGVPVFFNDAEWNKLYDEDEFHYASEEPFEADDYYATLNDKPLGKVLDLGCGDGVFSVNIDTNENVYDVEVSLSALKRLKRRNNKNMIPVCASGYELPFKDNTFDTVIFVYVIEHLNMDNCIKILNEIARVLKEDGRLVYVTDTPFFDKYLVVLTNFILRGQITNRENDNPHTGHINLMTMEESRELIGKINNYEIVKEVPFWYGQRFGIVNLIHKILRFVLPIKISEDYFTSKYTYIVKKK